MWFFAAFEIKIIVELVYNTKFTDGAESRAKNCLWSVFWRLKISVLNSYSVYIAKSCLNVIKCNASVQITF